MPNTPYVSAAAFRAHPTYLDLDGLRVNSTLSADQEAELTNILLMASEWADNVCNQPLGAHHKTQQLRQRLNHFGQLTIHPDDTPVLAVTSLAWGYSPATMSEVSDATLADAWVEDGRQILLALPGPSIPASAGLQFGGLAPNGELFVRLGTTAGYVATLLAEPASSGDTTLTVTDPTGILPGQTYRIWEPGAEESVTVSPNWGPPAATVPPLPTAVTLAAPTVRDHEAGHDFSRMPSDVRLAVTLYTIAQLQRPDTTAEDSYPDTTLSASLRSGDSRRSSTGLVKEATRILASYGRVR